MFRLPRIPILQRYVLRDLLIVFFFLLSVVTVLLVFVGVFKEMSATGLRPLQALQILPFIVPSLLPFTIPATLLLTVCVVYGRMAADREVIAAKAAGINVMTLLLPSFALGGVLSLCSLLLADRVIPWATHNIQATVSHAMEDIFLDMLRANGQVVDNNRGFSITVMGVEGRRLIHPTFHYQPKGSKPVVVQADEATLRFDLENRKAVLDMVNATVQMPGERRMRMSRESQAFPLPFESKKPKSRHLSIRAIRQKLDALHAELEEARADRDAQAVMALTLGDFEQLKQTDLHMYDVLRQVHKKELASLRTEIHSRFALSTSCFFFCLLGAPFAMLQGRRQFLTTFFMCFLPILLVYYPVALLILNLAKSETIPPVTIWAVNLATLIAAAVVLRKVMRH